MERLPPHAHSRFSSGIDTVGLGPDTVPQPDDIRIAEGWTLVPAEQEYLTDEQWFSHLANKEFPVTDYIRPPKHRDFTPLPDLFHDYFGHLAFMSEPDFADLAHAFGKTFFAVPQADRIAVARLWWHTAEFGLLREDGKAKAFGAGLISSPEELGKAMDPALHVPFDLRSVIETPKAKYETHPRYFVLEKFDTIRSALTRIRRGRIPRT